MCELKLSRSYYVYALYVCLICMPYMYALYVYLICMPAMCLVCMLDVCVPLYMYQGRVYTYATRARSYMYALYGSLVCMTFIRTPYMYALDVCLRCVPYVVALNVCLICMPYMYALDVCLKCVPYMYTKLSKPPLHIRHACTRTLCIHGVYVCIHAAQT